MDNEENNRIINPGVGMANITINNRKKAILSRAIKKIENDCDFIKENDRLKQRIFNIYDRLKEE